jgi:large subunit ribosomal protein L15
MAANMNFMIGKWIVQLQTSLSLAQERPTHPTKIMEDPFGRTPYRHPALEGLEELTHDTRSNIINKKQLAQLGQKYGLQNVIRWAPKNVRYF